jgi:hypothetical protein
MSEETTSRGDMEGTAEQWKARAEAAEAKLAALPYEATMELAGRVRELDGIVEDLRENNRLVSAALAAAEARAAEAEVALLAALDAIRSCREPMEVLAQFAPPNLRGEVQRIAHVFAELFGSRAALAVPPAQGTDAKPPSR